MESGFECLCDSSKKSLDYSRFLLFLEFTAPLFFHESQGVHFGFWQPIMFGRNAVAAFSLFFMRLALLFWLLRAILHLHGEVHEGTLRTFCAQNVALESFYNHIEVLIHKNMIEELAALFYEVEIPLRILHPVPDVLLGIAAPASESVEKL